jgi:hypothetical protein
MKKYWIVSLVITISFFYNYVDAQEIHWQIQFPL